MKKTGTVYLIGAGPGDPGLLTIKGRECLERADIIVYDYLVNTKLLDYAKEGAEIVYVGKRKGHKEMTQEEINNLIIGRAKDGNLVARLKGGDPFIFGRGGEEAESLSRHGVPFEVVPGVTSASSVAAYAGIPLTHRDFTSAFAVITGHEVPTKKESGVPWKVLPKIGTLVFLMGVKNLDRNMRKLMDCGMSPETPVSVITWGTFPEQRTITGTVKTIGESVSGADDITSPATIVIGEVVKLRKKINWFETKPLFGKKILVTRPKQQAGVFSKLLSEQGAEPVEFPTIEIVPPENWEELDGAICALSTYDWLIFTSVNGVKFFIQRLRELSKDLRAVGGIKIAAIGEKTAGELRSQGLEPDIVPDDFRAEGIISCFAEIDLRGKRILIPRAKLAREILPKTLSEMGAHVDVITAYRTNKACPKNRTRVKEMMEKGEIDIVTFTSSSTAQHFFSILGDQGNDGYSNCVFACIGPITADTVKKITRVEPEIICKKYTIQELTNEIVSYFKRLEQSGE